MYVEHNGVVVEPSINRAQPQSYQISVEPKLTGIETINDASLYSGASLANIVQERAHQILFLLSLKLFECQSFKN